MLLLSCWLVVFESRWTKRFFFDTFLANDDLVTFNTKTRIHFDFKVFICLFIYVDYEKHYRTKTENMNADEGWWKGENGLTIFLTITWVSLNYRKLNHPPDLDGTLCWRGLGTFCRRGLGTLCRRGLGTLRLQTSNIHSTFDEGSRFLGRLAVLDNST